MTMDIAREPGMMTLAALGRLAGCRHGFFTREGGVSEGSFASLNCGFSTGDARDRVQANRELAMARLDLPLDCLATVSQVHGARVIEVDAAWPPADIPAADGLVTRRRGLALGVLGADCAPILLADREAGVIGAAHAGWRGALAGVLEQTVAAMIRLGARPEGIIAAIGPCIGAASYEVGPDFPAPFLAEDANSAMFFMAAPRDGHFLFDLPGYIRHRLTRARLSMIAHLPADSFREQDRFFSHRRASLRGEPACGRMLSAIALER